MAQIFPFRAWHYDPGKVRAADAVTEPYDKVSPEMRERYLAASPYNFIRVEKGLPRPGDSARENVYTRAASTLADWIRAGVLIRESEASLYPYFQEYAVPGSGLRRTRRGFVGLGQLEDYAAGVVFRHERTLPGPKQDRLALLRETRTQTGLLFMLYQDGEHTVERILAGATRAAPLLELADDRGVVHRLWALSDPHALAAVAAVLAPRPLVIADGHHRYETALAYRDECRRAAGKLDPASPSERAMMAFFDTGDEGLTVLPTHRLVAGLPAFDFAGFRLRLEQHFDCRSYPYSNPAERQAALAAFRGDLEREGRGRNALGAYAGGGTFHLFLLRSEGDLERLLADLTPAERRLDVVLAHRVLLGEGLGITQEEVSGERRVGYERDLEAALEAVDCGRAQLALLLNPVTIDQVTEVALSGRVLPEKSTDFYPKLLSGLVLYRLDGA